MRGGAANYLPIVTDRGSEQACGLEQTSAAVAFLRCEPVAASGNTGVVAGVDVRLWACRPRGRGCYTSGWTLSY